MLKSKMLTKGMRSLFFHSSKQSSSPDRFTSAPSSPSPSHSHGSTFAGSAMDEILLNAEAIIGKWNPDSSTYAKITSLFYENRREARDFLRSVADLQRAMHFYVSSDSSTTQKLVRAQILMQTAMKRLEKEFYQILAANREHLDPESLSDGSSNVTRSSLSDWDYDTEDEIQAAGDSIREVERDASLAKADLRAIAECMISSGYAKECVKIYKTIRKSIVDEGIFRLGFDRTASQRSVHKMDWEVVDVRIKGWIHAIKSAVKNLFLGERALCDHVFATSDLIKESCFSEITREAAVSLFGFAESVSRSKRTPEKIFRFLDMYITISELWPEIDSIFSHESTSDIGTQALNCLVKLGDAIRASLANFESLIQKDSSRLTVPDGGLHPLTRYVMDYVCCLVDFSETLADIFADYPVESQSPVPPSVLENSPTAENPLSSISVRLEWLILILLCKLDGKSEKNKDVSFSYLFLANNLRHVISKVESSSLRHILGDGWVSKHESKARLYAASYEQMSWGKVAQTLPPNPTAQIPLEEARDAFRRFNSVFESEFRSQSGWVVPDPKMRDEIRESIEGRIVPPYRAFYETYRELLRADGAEHFVRFAPEDLEKQLANMFSGSVSGSGSGSGSSAIVSSTQSPARPHGRRWTR